jgi:hypothetical protein
VAENYLEVSSWRNAPESWAYAVVRNVRKDWYLTRVSVGGSGDVWDLQPLPAAFPVPLREGPFAGPGLRYLRIEAGDDVLPHGEYEVGFTDSPTAIEVKSSTARVWVENEHMYGYPGGGGGPK